MAIFLYSEDFADRFNDDQGLSDTTLVELNDTTTWMTEFIALFVGNPVEDHNVNESDFYNNGYGVLKDAIVAYAEEELNGMFEFHMEYDSEGHLVDELKEECIIKAKAQDKLGYQLFRIYSITKNHENDNIIVKAQHITYDLANNFVESLIASNMTKKQVMEQIGNNAVRPHPFNVTSTNNSTQSSTELYRTNPLQMIAGMQGSVLQIWGGQIERDNFHLIMHDRRGSDDGVRVMYKKNILGLEATLDISGLVTRIYPFVYIDATDDSPGRLITVDGKYIDSDLINTYSQVYIKELDYSSDDRIDTQDKTNAEIRSQLTAVANRYFDETGNDKPRATMEVAFEHLWETEEYKDVAPLELVGMGDTVSINHSKLNVDASAIVNYIRYDCIAMVNEEVKLGNVKSRLSDSINKLDSIEKKVEEAETNANQAIVSANGKSTNYYGPDEPTGNIKKDDLWFKVVNGRYTQTYRFDGIEWQLIMDLESYEAKEEAKAAKDAADEAYDNANIATGNATTAINKAQDGFDKALEALTKSDENEQSILTLNTETGNIVGRIESVNSRLDDLDSDDRNLITHLPQRWEQGYISTNTGKNNVSGNPNYIRALDYFDIKASEEYTLTTYGDYRVTLFYYDENHNYLDEYDFVLSDDHRTFTTPSNVKYARVAVDGLSNEVDTSMLGDEIKVKLQKSGKSSDWTPNLNDTAEFVHEFQLTANSLASRITDNEGNINSIANTVDGFQQTIGDVEGDLNTVTNIASATQQQLSNVEGDVNTLTSTANSLVSRLDNSGGRNLIENSRGDSLVNWSIWSDTATSIHTLLDKKWIRVSRGTSRHVGIYTPHFDIKADKTYTLSLTIRSYYNSGSTLNYLYLSKDGSTVKRLPDVNMSDNKFDGDISDEGVRVWFTFSHDEDIKDARVLIAISDRPENAGFLIREVQVEQSEIVNAWQPAPEDAYSQFSQLQRDINFRVKEGELLSQINVEADRILIDSSDKLVLSANTTYVTGDFKIDGSANIKDATIGTAQIGTIDAAIASIINFSANSIVGGMLSSQNNKVTFDLNNGMLNIDDGSINIKRPDGAIWVENGVPKFNFNVQTEFFLDENVNWTGRWFETNRRGSQRYKIAAFKHEGRFLKMNVITNLSWESPSQGEYMYFGVSPLNGKVITQNHLQRVNVQNNDSTSHVITIDLGKPTYQEVSVYLVFYKETLAGGGSHNDNIVQVRTNRIWQEG